MMEPSWGRDKTLSSSCHPVRPCWALLWVQVGMRVWRLRLSPLGGGHCSCGWTGRRGGQPGSWNLGHGAQMSSLRRRAQLVPAAQASLGGSVRAPTLWGTVPRELAAHPWPCSWHSYWRGHPLAEQRMQNRTVGSCGLDASVPPAAPRTASGAMGVCSQLPGTRVPSPFPRAWQSGGIVPARVWVLAAKAVLLASFGARTVLGSPHSATRPLEQSPCSTNSKPRQASPGWPEGHLSGVSVEASSLSSCAVPGSGPALPGPALGREPGTQQEPVSRPSPGAATVPYTGDGAACAAHSGTSSSAGAQLHARRPLG